jgi:hypothetical protein
MFFGKKKGTFPYLKKAPVIQGLMTLVLLLLPVGLFFIGYSITKDVKNLFTVVAVVGMLPAAKSIVSFIVFLRAEKYSCKPELHDKIQPFEGKGALIGYDYYLTSYSVNYPLPAAAVARKCLIALSGNTALKSVDYEDHIKEYMKKNEIKDITVKVFDKEERFLERLAELAASEDEITEDEAKSFALLASLSI